MYPPMIFWIPSHLLKDNEDDLYRNEQDADAACASKSSGYTIDIYSDADEEYVLYTLMK